MSAGVVALDRGHRVIHEPADDRLPGLGLETAPARLHRHPEDVLGPVLVGVLRIGALVLLGLEPNVHLLEGVGDVLEEDQPEDDVLVLGRVHRATQGIGHAPKLGLVAGRGALSLGRPTRGLRCRTGRRRRRPTTVTLGLCGWPDEACGEIRLFPAGVVQVELSAQLLQAISGEFRQQLVEPDLPGAGQRVDKLCPDAAVIDVQLEVVDLCAKLLRGQLVEDGALRRHRSASFVLPRNGVTAFSAWTSAGYTRSAASKQTGGENAMRYTITTLTGTPIAEAVDARAAATMASAIADEAGAEVMVSDTHTTERASITPGTPVDSAEHTIIVLA